MGFVRYNKSNIPCQCGYPDGMSPLGRMVFPRAPPLGKPSSLWETFHQDTHTGMAYLYNVLQNSSPIPGLSCVSIEHAIRCPIAFVCYIWIFLPEGSGYLKTLLHCHALVHGFPQSVDRALGLHMVSAIQFASQRVTFSEIFIGFCIVS